MMRETSFTVRNYRPADFDSYVQLHREAAGSDGKGRPVSRQRMAEALGHPSFHPETDLFIAESRNGIIGATSVFLEHAILRAILDCMVDPRHRKRGVARALAREAIGHAENEHSRVVQVCIPESNLAAKSCASHLGFKFIRRFMEMKLDLGRARLPAAAPVGYIIRHFDPGEAGKLAEIQNRAFADSWGFNPNTTDEIVYRTRLGCCSAENIILAEVNGRPIGYCWTQLLNEDERAVDGMHGEIHMLGVDPDFRRRGIGRNVLLAGLSHLKRKGITIARLTADGEETTALGLYESVGFEIYSRSEWYEKKLF